MRADYLLNSGNSIIKVFYFKVKFNEFRGEEALDSRIGWMNTGHWILGNGYWRLEIGVWKVQVMKKRREEREGGPVGSQLSGVQLFSMILTIIRYYNMFVYRMESILVCDIE